MRICMVGYTNFDYDARLHRYTQALIARGDSVDMIGLGDPDDLRVDNVAGVRVFRVSSRNLHETHFFGYVLNVFKFIWKSFIELHKLQKQNPYEVIHFHNIPDFGIFCTLSPKLKGAKIILDIHDLVPEFYMRKFDVPEKAMIIRFLKWIEKISCMYADHVISVTDIWKDRVAERSVNIKKCSVIMNLPISSVFKKLPFREHEKGTPFIIRYHGNLAEQTGVDIAIKAIEQLKDAIPDIQFKIIGDGNAKEELENLINKNNLSEHVHMTESVPVIELPGYLTDAHLAIDPKRDGVYAGETLSVKSMEYIKLGIPLIVSETVSAKYYFDSEFVRFFKPEDATDLAAAIKDLYENQEKRRQLASESDRFYKKYNWEKSQQIYFNILEQLKKVKRN